MPTGVFVSGIPDSYSYHAYVRVQKIDRLHIYIYTHTAGEKTRKKKKKKGKKKSVVVGIVFLGLGKFPLET